MSRTAPDEASWVGPVVVPTPDVGVITFSPGTDVTPENFIETAKAEGAQFIGMSALLTTTMPVMKEVIDQIRKENLEGKIKTLIGGAAVSKSYAEEIGATAYCYDGSNAVEYLNSII